MAPAEPENDAGASRSLTWRSRRIALVAFDACCWVFALFAATVLRSRLSRERWRRVSGVGVRGTHADLAALLDSPDVVLADIRGAETINAICKERRPDVGFHGSTKPLAAADLRNPDDSPPGAPCHGTHLPCTSSASF